MMLKNNKFVLGINNLQFSEDSLHVNKMPFSGLCAFVDMPTDGSPCGADGMKVVFTKEAVERALATFVGMGVNCVWEDSVWSSPEQSMTGHNERFKIGVVDSASLEDNEIHITGSLWQYDFADICFLIRNAKESLGFSVEIVANKAEEREGVIYVTDLTFTGVAILYRDMGAFKETKLAFANAQRSEVRMTEEQVKELLEAMKAEVLEANEAKFVELNDALTQANEKVAELEVKLSEGDAKLVEASEKLVAFAEEKESMVAENSGLAEKVEALGLELSEVKEKKVDKVERKSMQFNTLSKYGEDKTLEVLCSDISEDQDLTPAQKWELKLNAWKKSREA